MTAEDMFKILGYKKIIDCETHMYYICEKRKESIIQRADIAFFKNDKTIDAVCVPASDIIAILYQCKELGWVEWTQRKC